MKMTTTLKLALSATILFSSSAFALCFNCNDYDLPNKVFSVKYYSDESISDVVQGIIKKCKALPKEALKDPVNVQNCKNAEIGYKQGQENYKKIMNQKPVDNIYTRSLSF